MPWREYDFRGQAVLVRVMADGKPFVRRGLVEFRYRLGGNKSYKSARENLGEPSGEILPDSSMGGAAGTVEPPKETPESERTATTIVIHTDGACSGNPGPAGVGIVVQRPQRIVEIAEYMGDATNNAAELTAILRGLEELTAEEKSLPVHLYTDSAWSIGVLVGGWKAKTNLELIGRVKACIATFERLEMLKVRGHAGDPDNERADHLATTAVRREESSRRERVVP